MARIAYVTNAPAQSGMGKPAREILRQGIRGQGSGDSASLDLFEIDGPNGTLTKNGEQVAKIGQLPGPLSVKPVQWWRLSKHLPNDGYDLWHLTNQTLSFIPRKPVIVTVHDLIELLDPQERFGRAVAKRLYSGIPNADHLICISEYTKKTVQENYGIPDDRITVIPHGVSESFRAIPGAKDSLDYHEFLRQQRVELGTKIVLYVGSDHPRKNLGVLAEALASTRREIPNIVLLKVGNPGLREGRERFLRDLDRLGVRDAVRFISDIDEEQLRFFYSIADVFVFPSIFEGFGMPPLEAMACGCPVVSSNATSLPEVVGDAGILCDPKAPGQFTSAILRVLNDSDIAHDLGVRGSERAKSFSWKGVAEKTAAVYNQVLS